MLSPPPLLNFLLTVQAEEEEEVGDGATDEEDGVPNTLNFAGGFNFQNLILGFPESGCFHQVFPCFSRGSSNPNPRRWQNADFTAKRFYRLLPAFLVIKIQDAGCILSALNGPWDELRSQKVPLSGERKEIKMGKQFILFI